MNKYVKEFLHRGLIFGGFGPIVAGIVFWILDLCGVAVAFSGVDAMLAIVSTYLLAFLHAGASVFNQIEHWPIAKSLACHFFTLYVAYSLTYVLNSWIPFEPAVLLVFSGLFVALYAIIWLSVFFAVRSTTRRLNGAVGRK